MNHSTETLSEQTKSNATETESINTLCQPKWLSNETIRTDVEFVNNNINLEKIKSDVENMSKIHHIEILKILKKNSSIKLNENKSGVYINLSFLSENTLTELQNYIHYIQDQEYSLNQLEYQKTEFKNTFFLEKGVKDEPTLSYSTFAK